VKNSLGFFDIPL